MSNPQAQAEYHLKRREVERKARAIKAAVKAHREEAGDNLNWGHVGDLAYIDGRLTELLAFLRVYE